MFFPYQSNSHYISDYEFICIVVNDKIRIVPLNILSIVFDLYAIIMTHLIYACFTCLSVYTAHILMLHMFETCEA